MNALQNGDEVGAFQKMKQVHFQKQPTAVAFVRGLLLLTCLRLLLPSLFIHRHYHQMQTAMSLCRWRKRWRNECKNFQRRRAQACRPIWK